MEVSSTSWTIAAWQSISGDIDSYLTGEVAEIKTRREQFEIDGVLVDFDFFTFDPIHEPLWRDEDEDNAERERYVGRIKIRREVAADHFEQEKQKIQYDLIKFIKKYKALFRGYDFGRLGLGQRDAWCKMRQDEQDHHDEFWPFSGSTRDD